MKERIETGILAVFQKYKEVEKDIMQKEWEKEQILDLLPH